MKRKGRRLGYRSPPLKDGANLRRAELKVRTIRGHSLAWRALAEPISRFVAWKYLIPGSTYMAPHRTGGTLIE